MRRILLLLALLALPVAAQQQTISSQSVFPIQSDTTTLLAAADVVKLSVSGQQWASVTWVVSTAGSGGITTEYTNDPRGTASGNWLASPYSKRLDQVSANPSIATWANNTPVAGTYETPLPGNATAFRIRYQTAGTATVIQISAGAPFTPGVSVVATLYDVTEGSTGAGLAATVFDLAGWQATTINFAVPTTQVWTARFLDSTGASVVPGITTTAAGSSVLTISPGGASLSTLTLASNSINAIGSTWSRISLTLPAGGTVSTGRAVVMVRR